MSDIKEEQKRLYKRAEENDIKLLQDKYNKQKEVLDKIKEYIDKYLYEHVIDDLPDEESKFEKEDGTPIPNAKEQLLNILKGDNK